MNKRQIALIILLLVVVGFLYWYYARKRFTIQWLNDGKLKITFRNSTTTVDPQNLNYTNTVDKSGTITVNNILNDKLYIVVFGEAGKIIANATYDLTSKKVIA